MNDTHQVTSEQTHRNVLAATARRHGSQARPVLPRAPRGAMQWVGFLWRAAAVLAVIALLDYFSSPLWMWHRPAISPLPVVEPQRDVWGGVSIAAAFTGYQRAGYTCSPLPTKVDGGWVFACTGKGGDVLLASDWPWMFASVIGAYIRVPAGTPLAYAPLPFASPDVVVVYNAQVAGLVANKSGDDGIPLYLSAETPDEPTCYATQDFVTCGLWASSSALGDGYTGRRAPQIARLTVTWPHTTLDR